MFDEQLFHQQVLAAYKEIAPESGPSGEYLIRRLSTALYERGARIDIGASLPAEKKLIHHSIDLEHRFVWVGKLWAQIMGVRPHSMIGRHVSDVMTPNAMSKFLDRYWPTLLTRGKAEEDVALVTASGVQIEGHVRGEVLRDPEGSFVRTFARITLFLPRVCGALIPLSTGWYYLVA